MRCSACGARYDNPSVRCPECGARQEQPRVETAPIVESAPVIESAPVVLSAPVSVAPKPPRSKPAKKPRFITSTPSLIEFPGPKTGLPQWRRELGERVRERRARESVAAEGGTASVFSELGSTATATLELLPQTESPDVNPLVVAALRRIERARCETSDNGSLTPALAYDQPQPQLELEAPTDGDVAAEPSKPERAHNLAVVPPPEPLEIQVPNETRKPIRIIGDQNDPALNYLDSIPTSVTVDARGFSSASTFLRIPSALVDLAIGALLCVPFLALTELTTVDWGNPRVVSFIAATFVVMSFLYLTVSTAFTGRTMGMKLFSLRVVDVRTGLIPTGSQSAGRAIVYLLSLASAGIVLLLTFIDREKQTLHDRLTHTVVVRA